MELVNRLQRGQFGDVNFNEYQVLSQEPVLLQLFLLFDLMSPSPSPPPPPPPQPTVEFFTKDVMIHPVTNRPADKRSFIPSLLEKEKVRELHASPSVQ